MKTKVHKMFTGCLKPWSIGPMQSLAGVLSEF